MYLAALLLVFLLPVSAADTSHACSVTVPSWDCIGAVEMRVGERAFPMSRYANDEMLP